VVREKNIRIAAAGYLRFFLIVKGALRRSFFVLDFICFEGCFCMVKYGKTMNSTEITYRNR